MIDWIRRHGLVLLFPALVLASLFLPSHQGGMDVGDTVKSDASVKVLASDGTASLVGAERPVVMEFWASWCTPCKKSVPALNAAATGFGDDADFVAINVEEPLSDAEVEKRADDFGYTFNVGKAPESIQADFAITHLPTLLVAYRGRVTYRHSGVVDGPALVAHIKDLATATP